jgi:hypothetical protein
MSDLPNLPSDRVTEQLQELYQLFQSGAINAEEYAQAKAKILNPTANKAPKPEPTNIDTQIQLLQVEMENALLRTEQNWEQERESHLIYPENGRPYEPSDSYVGWSIFGSIFLGSLGIMLIMMMVTTSSKQSGVIWLMILGLIIAAICLPLYAKSKASSFQQAKEAYWLRRTDIHDRYQARIKQLKDSRKSSL